MLFFARLPSPAADYVGLYGVVEAFHPLTSRKGSKPLTAFSMPCVISSDEFGFTIRMRTFLLTRLVVILWAGGCGGGMSSCGTGLKRFVAPRGMEE